MMPMKLPSPYQAESLVAWNAVGSHVYANVRCMFNCLPSDRVLRSNSVQVTAPNTIPPFHGPEYTIYNTVKTFGSYKQN
jgi:hypothetical protein